MCVHLLQSKNCRLANLPPKALVRHKEEAQEFGGYFIVNGNERIVRMLIMPRRNYVSGTPMANDVGSPSEHHQQSVAHSPRRWQANGVLPGNRELEVLIRTQPAAGGDTPTWSHPTLNTPHTEHTPH